MNITVYLGAAKGNSPALERQTARLGTWIAENGHTLIYGGSRTGLMGVLAMAALDAGGPVIGVEPRFFVEGELQLEGLTQLIVTQTMAERKQKVVELGDAFIAMPGGTGTLEEIAEVMSLVSLKQLHAPCILFNLNGYYDNLRAQLDVMRQAHLSSQRRQRGITFASSLEEIAALLSPESPTCKETGKP